MKAAKHTSKAAPHKRTLSIGESSGDLVCSNYWIKIGLPRDVAKALTDLGKRRGCRKSPCEVMARHLLALAVLNEADTEMRLGAALKYMEAEDFVTFGEYCEGVVRARQAASLQRKGRRT